MGAEERYVPGHDAGHADRAAAPRQRAVRAVRQGPATADAGRGTARPRTRDGPAEPARQVHPQLPQGAHLARMCAASGREPPVEGRTVVGRGRAHSSPGRRMPFRLFGDRGRFTPLPRPRREAAPRRRRTAGRAHRVAHSQPGTSLERRHGATGGEAAHEALTRPDCCTAPADALPPKKDAAHPLGSNSDQRAVSSAAMCTPRASLAVHI